LRAAGADLGRGEAPHQFAEIGMNFVQRPGGGLQRGVSAEADAFRILDDSVEPGHPAEPDDPPGIAKLLGDP
jgi:hypothetical protein